MLEELREAQRETYQRRRVRELPEVFPALHAHRSGAGAHILLFCSCSRCSLGYLGARYHDACSLRRDPLSAGSA